MIGFVHYLFHRSTAMLGPTCYLQDMFTMESARGKGVGRALIEAVCVRAKAAGASRVYWNTSATNATARALYDKVATRQVSFNIERTCEFRPEPAAVEKPRIMRKAPSPLPARRSRRAPDTFSRQTRESGQALFRGSRS